MTKVLEFPTKSLTEVSTPLTQEEIIHNVDKQIIYDMQAGLDKFVNKAVGIAAPQVGHNRRIIIVNTNTLSAIMINPMIVSKSEAMQKSYEGCLSVPKINGNVQRHWDIVMDYIDELGMAQKLLVTGFDATVVQHEVDHLDGILFTDHLTGSDKKKADNKLSKRK